MQTLNMLLIEDSAAEARLIRELLAEVRHAEVKLAHSATLEEGLAHLEGETVDLVLLDLSLPDSHGLETLQRVRGAASGLPVIVLTGSDEEELALRAVEKGAQDYLVKGQVDGKAILRSARYAIARARTLEALRKSQRFMHQFAELVYVVNPKTHVIDHLSSPMERLLGLPAVSRSRSRQGLDALLHPDDLEAFRERMKNAMSLTGNEVIESEFRLRTAEQGWCWVHVRETVFIRHADGTPSLLLGTAQVLANRPQTEQGIAAELHLLNKVLDALPQPIFVKDQEGRFLVSNAAHRRSLGIQQSRQILGKTDFELLPPALAQMAREQEQALTEHPPGSDPRLADQSIEDSPSGQFKKTVLRNLDGAVIAVLGVGEETK